MSQFPEHDKMIAVPRIPSARPVAADCPWLPCRGTTCAEFGPQAQEPLNLNRCVIDLLSAVTRGSVRPGDTILISANITRSGFEPTCPRVYSRAMSRAISVHQCEDRLSVRHKDGGAYFQVL
ncbi:MAG: hypothetical protein Q8N51_17620 [Gammaproteobacteria bacterium]|nr:hypothetical protein [Gammaproteobacteria bacterium]